MAQEAVADVGVWSMRVLRLLPTSSVSRSSGLGLVIGRWLAGGVEALCFPQRHPLHANTPHPSPLCKSEGAGEGDMAGY